MLYLTTSDSQSKGEPMAIFAFCTEFWSQFWPEFKKDWRVAPNLITEARLIISPFPAMIYLYDPDRLYLAAMLLFVFVAATDNIDGRVARKWNLITKLGAFLDPTVDKILVVTTLVALSIVQPLVWVPTVIITVRELYVFFFLRRAKNRGQEVAVVRSGKVKMFVQCFAIAMLFLPQSGIWQLLTWTVVLLAIVLTVTSWIDYIKAFSNAKRRQ